MTNTIQHFGLTENQIVRKDNQFYLPVSTLAETLDVTPRNIQQLISRNPDDFEGANLKFHIFETPSGKQEGYLLNEEQVYILCMMMTRSAKAREFRHLFAKTLRQIREKEYVHISEVKKMVDNAALLNRIPAIKLGRYKKFRDMGLNRKEACKALNLAYETMKKVDMILGYKPAFSCEHLKMYYFKPKAQLDMFKEAKCQTPN